VTKQSHKKCLGAQLDILKNEIAAPFGLAMTSIVGMIREKSTTICAVRERKLGLAKPLGTGIFRDLI
jgi:hypothetical protein